MGSLQIPNIVKLVRREHSRKTVSGSAKPYLAHLFRRSEGGYAAAGINQRNDKLEPPRSNSPGRHSATCFWPRPLTIHVVSENCLVQNPDPSPSTLLSKLILLSDMSFTVEKSTAALAPHVGPDGTPPGLSRDRGFRCSGENTQSRSAAHHSVSVILVRFGGLSGSKPRSRAACSMAT